MIARDEVYPELMAGRWVVFVRDVRVADFPAGQVDRARDLVRDLRAATDEAYAVAVA